MRRWFQPKEWQRIAGPAHWRGTFPRIALDAELDRDLFYGSYVQTYLQRDVRALANVGDEMAFMKFLR
ncbi:MAG: hypothetical protein HQ567_31795, partial [Candidatus Nealsonbacteria bacterium]|nr:hypothetical protein [Candidatus Nealsonbacteria bacterium]